MSANTAAETTAAFSITRVQNFDKWFAFAPVYGNVHVRCVVQNKAVDTTIHRLYFSTTYSREVEVIRHFYDRKLGQVGCYWGAPRIPIEFKYAKLKFGDIFDFYTSEDGVLQIPDWCGMKYAVDQYLEEDPRVKYHPSRVRQFVEEHGVEELELME